MARPSYQVDRPVKNTPGRRYRRTTRLAGLVLLSAGIVALALAYDTYRVQQTDNQPVTGPAYNQTIAGPRLFKSSYFQFSDSANWVYEAKESTANKIIYRLYQAKLPAHSVTVYVNQVPPENELATTRTLPVQLVNGNAFTVGELSEPCSKQYKPSDPKRIKTVTIGGTNMLCVPDSPQLSVAVGEVGGNYGLTLKRASGQTARYIIIYRNLTADPDAGPFLRVMKSFQAL